MELEWFVGAKFLYESDELYKNMSGVILAS